VATPFPAEVLTPEGEAYSGKVELVSTRTGVGSIGVRANHAPLLATLEPCELRLYTSESEVVRFAQAEGYLQVVENEALVLVEEAIPPEDLDQSTLQSQLEEARRSMEQAEEETEEHARYERDVRRYEAFLEVAGS
jgi:F-type H+-transporting ATPase subunit epsilon